MVSEKKSSFSKLHWTTKILIVYLIKKLSLFYFLPKKWWSCGCFFFSASEALKNFWGPQKRSTCWIIDLKVCLKKLGIGPGLYEKSVLYLNVHKGPAFTFYSSVFIELMICVICSHVDMQTFYVIFFVFFLMRFCFNLLLKVNIYPFGGFLLFIAWKWSLKFENIKIH